MPRVRLTIRTMMIVVAIFAASCYGARRYWIYRTWWWWLQTANPLLSSSLNATVEAPAVFKPGEPIKITVTYDFHLDKPKPFPGMTFQVWGETWIEDYSTRFAVAGSPFVVPLTSGGRESASGEFTWEATVARPGQYLIRHALRYQDPLGEWHEPTAGASGFRVEAHAPAPPSE